MGIAHLGAARRQDVMERAGCDFRRKKCPRGGHVYVHFRRRLGLRDHLEFQCNPVHNPRFAGLSDIGGRRNQRDIAARNPLADAAAHLALRSGCQVTAKLVICPPPHRRTGHDIFGRSFGNEMFGRNDCDLACPHLRFIDHATHPAEMVAVAMAVDHRAHRSRAQLVVHQPQRRCRRVARGQRVDEYPAGLTLDDGHIRHIETAHLPHIFRQREQPMASQQPHVPPQAGVDRIRGLTVHPCISVEVPYRLAILGLDDRVGQRADKPARGKIGIAAIVGRKISSLGVLCGNGGGRSRLRRVIRLCHHRRCTYPRQNRQKQMPHIVSPAYVRQNRLSAASCS